MTSNKFVQRDGLNGIPDSVLLNQETTSISLSPPWIIEGPLGMAPDAVSKNNVTKLPASICKLAKLRLLDLCMNDVKTLPPCFDQLQNLETLDLSYNRSFDIIKNLPVILRLKKLKSINLYGIEAVIKNETNIRRQLTESNIDVIIITRADQIKLIEHK